MAILSGKPASARCYRLFAARPGRVGPWPGQNVDSVWTGARFYIIESSLTVKERCRPCGERRKKNFYAGREGAIADFEAAGAGASGRQTAMFRPFSGSDGRKNGQAAKAAAGPA